MFLCFVISLFLIFKSLSTRSKQIFVDYTKKEFVFLSFSFLFRSPFQFLEFYVKFEILPLESLMLYFVIAIIIIIIIIMTDCVVFEWIPVGVQQCAHQRRQALLGGESPVERVAAEHRSGRRLQRGPVQLSPQQRHEEGHISTSWR
jgi:hypothetical protein